MTPNRIALVLGIVALAAPAAADVVGGQNSKVKNEEKIGVSTAGKPKPYWARQAAECNASSCFVLFGKKGNKVREIGWINCAFGTSNGITVVGVVGFNDLADQQGYFSDVSRALNGTVETAVLEYKNPLTVPAGASLFVYASMSGTGLGGQCTLGGTIE